MGIPLFFHHSFFPSVYFCIHPLFPLLLQWRRISVIKAVLSTLALDLLFYLFSVILPPPSHYPCLQLFSLFPLSTITKTNKTPFDSSLSLHCSVSSFPSSIKLLFSLHIHSSIYCSLLSMSTTPLILL